MNDSTKHSESPKRTYHKVEGGLPAQITRIDERAVFTDAYAFLPSSTMTDIVTSHLPHWEKTRLWVIARPLSGFAETFSQYIMEVAPGGGSQRPDDDNTAESVLFVTNGTLSLTVGTKTYTMEEGGYAYLPAGCNWSAVNDAKTSVQFHWIRKRYEAVDGLSTPDVIIVNEQDIDPVSMPDSEDRWATTRFVDPTDICHDMHVNIVTLQPGGVIPFLETHVMEHGLYVLEGKAAYKLNKDWIEVGAGDFMWLRAFCPQACYATGEGPFRYLLYKDVNRHAKLGSFLR